MSAPLLDVQIRAKRFGERRVLQDVRVRLAAGEIVVHVRAKHFGERRVLQDVRVRLAAGEIVALVGAGAVLAGPVRDIGFVFQEPRLFPWCSVAENVGFELGRAARGDARVRELIAEVGLAGREAALPKELSGGQAQRVALARGLVGRPRVLLMDEPFSAVDAFTRIHLQSLLAALCEHHRVAVLLVTHDVDEAAVLADRVLVLDSQPGTVREEIELALPRPRRREGGDVAAARRRIFHALHAVHAL